MHSPAEPRVRVPVIIIRNLPLVERHLIAEFFLLHSLTNLLIHPRMNVPAFRDPVFRHTVIGAAVSCLVFLGVMVVEVIGLEIVAPVFGIRGCTIAAGDIQSVTGIAFDGGFRRRLLGECAIERCRTTRERIVVKRTQLKVWMPGCGTFGDDGE